MRPPRLPRSRGAAALAAVVLTGATGLSGCSLFSPLPTIELIKASASAATVAIGQGPNKASNTVFQGNALPRQVCIEYNRSLAMPDFVPALMAELKVHEVSSRVFDVGVRPGDSECPAWLHYQGLQQWDKPPLSDQMRPYLAQATLSLHDAGGRLMSASSYQSEEAVMGLGKWGSTRNKLAPVVTALLTGFES